MQDVVEVVRDASCQAANHFQLLCLAELGLKSAPLREIERGSADSDQLSVRVPDRPVNHFSDELRAIFASEQKLSAPGLTPRQSRDDLDCLVPRYARLGDLANLAAKHLGRGPEEQTLCRRIHIGDVARHVGGDDGLTHRIEKLRLKTELLPGLRQRKFESGALTRWRTIGHVSGLRWRVTKAKIRNATNAKTPIPKNVYHR